MKRECPPSFFDEEDEDEDYLIEASLENDKENDLVSFDTFMTQEPTTSTKPGNGRRKKEIYIYF